MIIHYISLFSKYFIVLIAIIYFFASSVLLLDYIATKAYELPICFNNIKSRFKIAYFKPIKSDKFVVRLSYSEIIYLLSQKLFGFKIYKMFYLSSLVLIYTISLRYDYLFSSTLKACIPILMLLTIFYLTTKLPIIIIEKMTSLFIVNAIYILLSFIIYIGAFYSSLIALLEYNQIVPFAIIIMCLLLLLIPLLKFANACIETKSRNFNLMLIILIFMVFESSLYLMFGIYNLSLTDSYRYILNSTDSFSKILSILQFGTKYIFTYPEPPTKIEYTLQYLIGFFIHVIMFAYYISNVSSKILHVKKSKSKQL
jgi:hypothetical protein